ncbi:MAG: methyltransferase domain-containing protein [Candidatus Latescibacterota bacterium]|nr:MAG: methyltransferase domain-containing protein [Candidatus Latescibacterota bacterium]
MATDVKTINDNLRSFFDFKGKSVTHVGAGGGQIIDYAMDSKSVLALDNDEEAVRQLEQIVKTMDLKNVVVETADILDSQTAADVVLFEFCLHEIANPLKALRKGFELARDVVILDHATGSRWAWYTAETEKVKNSWSSVDSFNVVREKTYKAVQRFRGFSDLYDRIKILGEPSLTRISVFKDKTDIEIEMGYKLALISDEGKRPR